MNDTDQITVAHVLPRSTGMGLTTLLCKECNDRHGRLQDKWFGEHVHLVTNRRSVLGVSSQRGYFKIDGVRMGGRFQELPDGGLNFQYWPNKTSPESLKAAEDQFGGSTINIEAPIPLLEKQNQALVSVGFLTAAYLMLFRALGYSWVLQSHLDPVREQIRNPEADILPRNFCATSTKVFEKPWTGVGRVDSELVLVVGILDRVVFLPPFYRRDFYAAFPHSGKVHFEWLREFSFYKGHAFDGPVALLSGEGMLVVPDVFFESKDAYVIFLPPDGSKPQIMDFVTTEEFERQGKLPNVNTIHIPALAGPPDKQTGRERVQPS